VGKWVVSVGPFEKLKIALVRSLLLWGRPQLLAVQPAHFIDLKTLNHLLRSETWGLCKVIHYIQCRQSLREPWCLRRNGSQRAVYSRPFVGSVGTGTATLLLVGLERLCIDSHAHCPKQLPEKISHSLSDRNTEQLTPAIGPCTPVMSEPLVKPHLLRPPYLWSAK